MLTEAARILWRRRLWVIVALITALGTASGAFVSTPPTQRSTAQVLFVPSVKQPGVDSPTNPFLSLGGSVAVVASLIQIGVSDDQTAESLARSGHTALYVVEPNLNENAGPVLIVTTESPSAANSQGTMNALIDVMKNDLRERQASQNVEPDLMVTTVVLTATEKPLVVRKTQLQISVGAAAAVFLLLIGFLLLVERRRGRRALELSGSTATTDHEDSATPDPSEPTTAVTGGPGRFDAVGAAGEGDDDQLDDPDGRRPRPSDLAATNGGRASSRASG